MSKFNSVVPVPLGEIRRLDGKLLSQAKPGTLVTAVAEFAGGSDTHFQPATPNAKFTLNVKDNVRGVLIVMEQEELFMASPLGNGVGGKISDDYAAGSHVRAHVLKSGEEVTVILTAAATINSGDLLYTEANGTVKKVSSSEVPMFIAIEPCASGAEGDDLRILARVL